MGGGVNVCAQVLSARAPDVLLTLHGSHAFSAFPAVGLLESLAAAKDPGQDAATHPHSMIAWQSPIASTAAWALFAVDTAGN